MALLGRLFGRKQAKPEVPDWRFAMVRFLMAARLRHVIDLDQLCSEAAAIDLAPAQLLRQRAPLRAVVGRGEVLRLAATGVLIDQQLADGSVNNDIIGLVRELCSKLGPPPREQIERDLIAGHKGLRRTLEALNAGTPVEQATSRGLEECCMFFGRLLADAFLEQWAAGNHAPMPPAEGVQETEVLLFDAERLEQVWLKSLAKGRPDGTKAD